MTFSLFEYQVYKHYSPEAGMLAAHHLTNMTPAHSHKNSTSFFIKDILNLPSQNVTPDERFKFLPNPLYPLDPFTRFSAELFLFQEGKKQTFTKSYCMEIKLYVINNNKYNYSKFMIAGYLFIYNNV